MTFRSTYTVTVEGPEADQSIEVRRALEAQAFRIHGTIGIAETLVRKQVTPTGSQVNRPKLIKLAQWAAGEHAKQQLGLPSEWDQASWLKAVPGLEAGPAVEVEGTACGTSCCMAGKVALDAGAVPAIFTDDGYVPFDDPRSVEALYQGIDFGHVVLPDGTDADVADFAQRELGITDHQAGRLFSGQNDLDTVLTVIRQILDESKPVVRWVPEGDEAPARTPQVGDTVRIVNTGRYGAAEHLDGLHGALVVLGTHLSDKHFRVTLTENSEDGPWHVGTTVSAEEVEVVEDGEVSAEDVVSGWGVDSVEGETPQWQKGRDVEYNIGAVVQDTDGQKYRCDSTAYHNTITLDCSTCWTKIDA